MHKYIFILIICLKFLSIKFSKLKHIYIAIIVFNVFVVFSLELFIRSNMSYEIYVIRTYVIDIAMIQV